MSLPAVNYPSFSVQFWWEGTLRYIDPREKDYQRCFLLYLSCISSLSHEFERKFSYEWSSYVHFNTLSKALISASNYWRVYDCVSAVKIAVEKLMETKFQESLFKWMGAFSSVTLLLTELYNRKAIQFESIDSLKFTGGVLGGTVYFRKSVMNWIDLGKPTENREKVNIEARQYLFSVEKFRDIMDMMTYISIFAIKIIGLTILLSKNSQLSGIRYIIENQSWCLLGCFAFATGCSLVSHFSEEYLNRYIELNKRLLT
ncbi:hypothetical protein [Simkania negevensis]|uniref:Uncharacterized protein n=1 Tax=Simkania negevensis (strain ATCC VR-1471 / DSM 27360 / Z) TaxID=331113 RepID=F8L3X9_SIMNZ|nr:hypothetical protein [Simkania negevensis]CCB90009.1 unknown protein [Simkania negevensis Z]